MANRFTLKAPAAFALAAGVAKTIIAVKAGGQLGIDVNEASIEFDGTSPTASVVLVELVRLTSDPTATSRTPTSKGSIANAATSYCTGWTNATVEGTVTDIVNAWLIPPTAGKHIIIPLGEEYELGKGERFGFRATAPAIVNVLPNMGWRE